MSTLIFFGFIGTIAALIITTILFSPQQKRLLPLPLAIFITFLSTVLMYISIMFLSFLSPMIRGVSGHGAEAIFFLWAIPTVVFLVNSLLSLFIVRFKLGQITRKNLLILLGGSSIVPLVASMTLWGIIPLITLKPTTFTHILLIATILVGFVAQLFLWLLWFEKQKRLLGIFLATVVGLFWLLLFLILWRFPL